jgi:ABC-type transporter Mla MlaB component
VHAVVVLVRGQREVMTWPLADTDHLDLTVVDELARLQLGARRLGCGIRLRHVSEQLSGLLDVVGLRVEVEWQPERREESLGVEEVVVADDPVA